MNLIDELNSEHIAEIAAEKKYQIFRPVTQLR